MKFSGTRCTHLPSNMMGGIVINSENLCNLQDMFWIYLAYSSNLFNNYVIIIQVLYNLPRKGISQRNTSTKSVASYPEVTYAERGTAAAGEASADFCGKNCVAWSAPLISVFIDRNRSYSFRVAPQLSS
jgi:hypothetical protein